MKKQQNLKKKETKMFKEIFYFNFLELTDILAIRDNKHLKAIWTVAEDILSNGGEFRVWKEYCDTGNRYNVYIIKTLAELLHFKLLVYSGRLKIW